MFKSLNTGIVLFLLILVSHTSLDLGYGQIEENLLNFQNIDKNIEFEYPSNWQVDILDDDVNNQGIHVWSPNQNSLLMISYEYPFVKNAVKEIVESQIDLDTYNFKNYNFIELKEISFLNYNAWEYTYSSTDDFGNEIKSEELFFEDNNLLYIIGFSSTTEIFDKENFIANSIKNSLKIHPIDIKEIMFEDKENEFKFTYPKNWILSEEGLLDYCIVQLFSQGEHLDDQFSENMTFCVQDIPNDITLEQYANLLQSGMKKCTLTLK